ncbi:gluconate 2-dehydrogenase subunit 3 family protein [Haloplanus aerogenes]|uniref:Gluconate 2-dehydrogenase subunit 3 family protein n=1 Tax=Haloplanus aerogenes TaxID=660522 RepID=A0A3M0DTD5_9EURY|nr:gluconate 2-dehydrogenase subunit 3 family protein [Haloplanus aerogenes]AZH25695.1 gluconate 2-dehydrogenase subunit 3 family protein [Haloplanus aerogenes]RMB25428.1 gluconate 2-dehydrogenase subunit 3-like protein [Haloplanus aerogenes]
MTKKLDRRTFVRLAGAGAVASTAGCGSDGSGDGTDTAAATETATATETTTETATETPAAETYEFFDAAQAAVVSTLVDRLLPGSDDRPSATELSVVRYIDRALQREPFYETAHDDRRFQSAYEDGIARLQDTAQQLFDRPVTDLDESEVDDLLSQIQERSAPGWEDIPTPSPVTMTIPSTAFVSLLRDHAVEGYYAQPKYGGNVDLGGWRQARYVGPFIEGYTPDELKPPWKSFDEHEAAKTRPPDLYGEFEGGGES